MYMGFRRVVCEPFHPVEPGSRKPDLWSTKIRTLMLLTLPKPGKGRQTSSKLVAINGN